MKFICKSMIAGSMLLTSNFPALAGPAESIHDIVKSLQNNRFVFTFPDGSGRQRMDVLVGAYDHSLLVASTNAGLEACFFQKIGPDNSSIAYHDLGCNGHVDTIVREARDDNISEEEQDQYVQLIAQFEELSRVTRQFGSEDPQPRMLASPDQWRINMVRALVKDIDTLLLRTDFYAEDDKGSWCFRVVHSNSNSESGVRVLFCIKVDPQSNLMSNCTIVDANKRGHTAHFDDLCDGFYESFFKEFPGEDNRMRNSGYGMSIVHEALLNDVRRFAEFAAKYYPKSAN